MKTPTPTLFAAFCGTCGVLCGAESSKARAFMWTASTCVPAHSRKATKISKYVLAPTPKRKR